MSALPPKADIVQHGGNVHNSPESGHCKTPLGCLLCAKSGHWAHLFDHLVGDLLEMHRHVEV
jgi:hypothetical protein